MRKIDFDWFEYCGAKKAKLQQIKNLFKFNYLILSELYIFLI